MAISDEFSEVAGLAQLGLVVNAKNAMPDRSELAALGLTKSWVRTICYDLDSLDAALQTIDPQTHVCSILNSETRGYEDWSVLCTTFAQRFRGRVHAVEILNEADLLNIPVETAARMTITAAPILRAAGMKVVLSSVAGPDWPNYLSRLAAATRGYADYACLHGYGQRVAGFPANWGFGELADAIKTANDLSGLPVVLSEQGIKIGDAGGEQGQAEYIRRLAALLQTIPESRCPFVCYFAWRDDIGGPSERGQQAFGLRKPDGSPRPAWKAFAEAPKEPIVPPTPPKPSKPVVGAGIAAMMRAYGTEPATSEDYRPDPNNWGYSEAFGMDARRYVYLRATRQVLAFDPTNWANEDDLLNPKPPTPPPSPPALWPSPERVADILGAPLANVQANFPLLVQALTDRGIGDRPVVIGALGTVGVETSSFAPIPEWASGDEYEGRTDMGNTQPGDGRRYKGRGLIQLSGRSNYRTYGNMLGIDLEGNPDLALDPTIACQIFAVYFTEHRIRWLRAPAPLMNCADLARAGEWEGLRVAVNGGRNGLARFLEIVAQLEALS